MGKVLPDNLKDAHRGSRSRPGPGRFVDIHCHCLPGLDDGPATMAEAVALCRALAEDGCTTVIATPHQLGRYDGLNAPSLIRKAVSDLNVALVKQDVPLGVVPGADVRADERISALLDAGGLLTLADLRRHLLLELPAEIFLDLRPLIGELADRGITTIISHPERNAYLMRRPDAVRPWLEKGALLQLTAAGLCGDFGPAVEQAAWHYLETGTAALVATDAHDVDERPPRMSRAFGLITERLAHAVACRVCIANPARVLTGQEIESAAGGVKVGGRN